MDLSEIQARITGSRWWQDLRTRHPDVSTPEAPPPEGLPFGISGKQLAIGGAVVAAVGFFGWLLTRGDDGPPAPAAPSDPPRSSRRSSYALDLEDEDEDEDEDP